MMPWVSPSAQKSRRSSKNHGKALHGLENAPLNPWREFQHFDVVAMGALPKKKPQEKCPKMANAHAQNVGRVF
jgi:hypothetical protein